MFKKDVENIRKTMFIKKFEYELEDSNDFDLINDRKDDLKLLIEAIKTGKKNIRNINYSDKNSDRKELNSFDKKTDYSNTLDGYLNFIQTFPYKKRWNRMKSVNKLEKIKEYVSKQDLSENKKKELLEDLTIFYNNKKLHTEKHISYDIKKMEIEYINGLKIDNKNDNYTILKNNK